MPSSTRSPVCPVLACDAGCLLDTAAGHVAWHMQQVCEHWLSVDSFKCLGGQLLGHNSEVLCVGILNRPSSFPWTVLGRDSFWPLCWFRQWNNCAPCTVTFISRWTSWWPCWIGILSGSVLGWQLLVWIWCQHLAQAQMVVSYLPELRSQSCDKSCTRVTKIERKQAIEQVAHYNKQLSISVQNMYSMIVQIRLLSCLAYFKGCAIWLHVTPQQQQDSKDARLQELWFSSKWQLTVCGLTQEFVMIWTSSRKWCCLLWKLLSPVRYHTTASHCRCLDVYEFSRIQSHHITEPTCCRTWWTWEPLKCSGILGVKVLHVLIIEGFWDNWLWIGKVLFVDAMHCANITG